MLLTGWTAAAKHDLESWALETIFEFSLDYDLETARHAYRQQKTEEQKKSRPDDKVMEALGYTNTYLPEEE